MFDIDQLVHRYLEDRDALSAREFDALIAGLRADPELAARLRDQLLLDDLLAQKMALDRRNFVAQVEQRIADLNRGQAELSQQTADLRSMAAAERMAAGTTRWPWPSLMLALSLFFAVGAAIVAVRWLTPQPPAIATVTEVSGSVKIEQNGDSDDAEKDGSLAGGQRVVVPRGGSITLRYEDGTELKIKNDAAVTMGSEKAEPIKQIRIERGEVVANIKPQLAGAMRFATPHAVAVAPMSLLRIVVSDESTLLDVSEGKVQFDRLTDKRTIAVAANESAMASPGTLELRKLTWPDRRDGLAYLFSPLESAKEENKPLTVVRNPETRSLRTTPLEPCGNASLLENRFFYELSGGYLKSTDAGPDISKTSRGGSELTLEAVFSPASMEQAGPARIVALTADDDEPDFALDQEGPDFTFCLKTDAKPATTTPPRVTINTPDTPVHLTMTYRNGELIAYRDGMEIARSQDLWGSLAVWRPGPLTVGADASGERTWRGIMEALALYNRCLEPGEVARNARNYRLLAGRGM